MLFVIVANTKLTLAALKGVGTYSYSSDNMALNSGGAMTQMHVQWVRFLLHGRFVTTRKFLPAYRPSIWVASVSDQRLCFPTYVQYYLLL